MKNKIKNLMIFLLALLQILFNTGYVYSNAVYTTIKHSFVEVDFSQISGHHIVIGTNYSDWKGTAPTIDNTAIYQSNEYIYKDAWMDDIGDGDYAYPTGSLFKKGMADIVEFRVTYDSTNLFILVSMLDASPDPAGWSINGFVIGIHDETAQDGNCFFIQGDSKDPATGPSVELNTEIKLQYTIYASSTYKIRMWDHNGLQIGDGPDMDEEDGALNNMRVRAKEWNKYEIAIPLSLIGPVVNKKFKFIVGSCFEEGNIVREVMGYPLNTEWYITGGDSMWWVKDGPDPDVLDLIGAAQENQVKDLKNYREMFNNEEYDFEVFNFDIRPYIFSPQKNNDLALYFTASTKYNVTLNIKDMNGALIKNILQDIEVSPPAKTTKYYEYKWNGRNSNGELLKRGAYIVEAVFKADNKEKVIRKVVRIW